MSIAAIPHLPTLQWSKWLPRIVTSRTAPDSYQYSLSPAIRMPAPPGESVLPSIRTFPGVEIRKPRARLRRATQPRISTSGVHDRFSATMPAPMLSGGDPVSVSEK